MLPSPSPAHNFSLMDDKVSDCLASIWSKATVFDPHPAHLTCHRCALMMSREFENTPSDCATEPTLCVSGILWRQDVARCFFSSRIDHTGHISFMDVADGSRRQTIVYLRTSKSRLSRGHLQFSSCGCHCHERSHVSLQTYLVFSRHRNHHRPLHHHHHHHYQHRLSPTVTGSQRQPGMPSFAGPPPSAKDQRPWNLETTTICNQALHQDRSRGQGIADERSQQLCRRRRRLHRHVDSLVVGHDESRLKSVRDDCIRHYWPPVQPGYYPYPVGSKVSLPSPCCRKRHCPKAPEPSAARVWSVPISSIVWSTCRSETAGREFQLYILHVPTSALSSSSSSSSSGISNFLTDSRAEFATGIMMMMMMMMMMMTMMITMTMTLVRFCRIFYEQGPLSVIDDLVVTAVAVVADAAVLESPVNHGQATIAHGTRPSEPPGLSLRLAKLQCSSSALLSSSSSTSSSPSSSSSSSTLLSSPLPSSSSSSSTTSETKSVSVPSTVPQQEHRFEASSSHGDGDDHSDFSGRDDTCHNVTDISRPSRPPLDFCGRVGLSPSDILMPCLSFLYQLLQLLLVVGFCCRKWRSDIDVCRLRGDSSRKGPGGCTRRRKKQVSQSEEGTSSPINRTQCDRGSIKGGSRKILGGRGLGNIWNLPVLFW